MPRITVGISGVHSDPDPSPGIGIARSLREAYPSAILRAVDYSVRSSGLHDPVFDAVLLQPVWSELDLATYSSQIRAHMDAPTGFWISGLDVETDWLALTIGEHPRLLVPGRAAQELVRKPLLQCAPCLHMRVPEFLPASSAPTELHALGRRSGWHLWVKGKYHEAYAARGFAEMRRQVQALEAHWPLEDIFVQEHVSGLERSITFAAYKGRLLGAVEVEKRSVTTQGKTWAAAVTDAPADVIDRLASFCADARWTGGGEVEFVRDAMGNDWLIDFNPRFPAYIYGVTICGRNLPARLVGTALGIECAPWRDRAQQFIRVVHEVPVRDDLPLPRMTPSAGTVSAAGKHPSFQPELVRRLGVSRQTDSPPQERPSPPLPAFLANWRSSGSSPHRFRDFTVAEATLDHLASALKRCRPQPAFMPALSVKTDPHRTLAGAFLSRGWWAEVISLRELDWARAMGFKDCQIVFNGPAVGSLVPSLRTPVGVAFADSVEALEALVESHACQIMGLRVKSKSVASRFGVDLANARNFNRVVDCLKRCDPGLQLGLHVHSASDVCGPARWNDLVAHALVWADALTEASGAVFSVFDIGGGWHHDDFLDLHLPALPALQTKIADAVPSLTTIILEPGKALAADTAWLATRVIEVRPSSKAEAGEVVVDASIADLPMAALYGHRVLHVRHGRCLGWLTGGSQRILGSICMETDILAQGVGFPEAPIIGDELLFSSAGGYNASMAWHFASGVSRDI